MSFLSNYRYGSWTRAAPSERPTMTTTLFHSWWPRRTWLLPVANHPQRDTADQLGELRFTERGASLRRLKSLVHISAKIIWARRGCRARKECQPPRDRVDWRRWIQTRKSADVSDDWITSRLLLRSTYAGCARFIYWCCIRLNWQIRHFSLLGHLGSRSRAERGPLYIMRFIYHISPFAQFGQFKLENKKNVIVSILYIALL